MLTLTPHGNLAAYARHLADLPEEFRPFVPALGEAASPGSVMAEALTRVDGNKPQEGAIAEIRDRSLFSAAITAEACAAVSRLMVPKWTAQLATICVTRMALEAAGLVCWLLEPGLNAEQRIARYMGSADAESKDGTNFLNIAIRDASHLKAELVAVGSRSIRPARDAREELRRAGITAVDLEEPGKLAALIENQATYRAFSAAVHGSVAGIKEFNEILINPDRRAAFYLYLIELTARAHSLVAIRLHEYVRGPVSADFDRRLDRCASHIGGLPARLRP